MLLEKLSFEVGFERREGWTATDCMQMYADIYTCVRVCIGALLHKLYSVNSLLNLLNRFLVGTTNLSVSLISVHKHFPCFTRQHYFLLH